MKIRLNNHNKFKFLIITNLVYFYSFDCCESNIVDPVLSQKIEKSSLSEEETNNKQKHNYSNRKPNKIRPFFRSSPLKKKLKNHSNDTTCKTTIVSRQQEIETALFFLSLSGIVNSSKFNKSSNLNEDPFIKNIFETIIELYEIIENDENIYNLNTNNLLLFLDEINSENQNSETTLSLPDLIILLSLTMTKSASSDGKSEIKNRIKTIKNCKTCKTIINTEEKDNYIISIINSSKDSDSKRDKKRNKDDVCKKCNNLLGSDNHLLSVSKNILVKFENPTKIDNEFPSSIEKNDRKRYYLKYGIVEFTTADAKQMAVISRNDINAKWMIHKNSNSAEPSTSTDSMKLKYAIYSMKD